MTDTINHLAKIIDPEAWGLPDHDYKSTDPLSDRDEARYKASLIMQHYGETIDKRLVLMKLEASDRNVFFVIEQPKYHHHDLPDHTPDNDRYFYEQHSCPTNWFENIVAVIENDDDDPHGFLKFIRAIDAPADEPEDYRELFPEAFDIGVEV